MTEARIELLQKMPVFGAIKIGVLQFLLGVCPVVSRAAGNFFFREGEIGPFHVRHRNGRSRRAESLPRKTQVAPNAE
jgi:hypothetical protein